MRRAGQFQRAGKCAGALVTGGYFNETLSLAAALATLTLFVLVHLASAGLARPARGTGLLLLRIMLGLLLTRLSLSWVVLAVLAAWVLITLVWVRHKYLANACHLEKVQSPRLQSCQTPGALASRLAYVQPEVASGAAVDHA